MPIVTPKRYIVNFVSIDILRLMTLIKKLSKNIRKRWDKSLYELAKKAGIPYSTLGNIIFEHKKDVKLSTIIKIAKAMRVKVDELIK